MTTPAQERRRGRGWLIASLAVAGVVILAATIVLVAVVTRPSEQPDTTPAPTSSSTDNSSMTQGACGPVPFETADTLTDAPSTTWEPWGVTVLASSEAAGPTQANDHGIRSCYARTAEGALYAIMNAAAYCTDSRYSAEGAEQTIANGPGRDAAIANAHEAEPCHPAADLIRGYRVASYDGSNATIYLAAEVSGKSVAVPYQLVWEDGDWKGVFADDGSLLMAPGPLDSMTGYTSWGHHVQ